MCGTVHLLSFMGIVCCVCMGKFESFRLCVHLLVFLSAGLPIYMYSHRMCTIYEFPLIKTMVL